jgi:hypothetical protein
VLARIQDAAVVVDPKDAAESIGLRYVSDEQPGTRRKKAGKGFLTARGSRTGGFCGSLTMAVTTAMPFN